jgi:hypothetical protein
MGEILVTRKLNLMWGILMLKPSTELIRKTKTNVVVTKNYLFITYRLPTSKLFHH